MTETFGVVSLRTRGAEQTNIYTRFQFSPHHHHIIMRVKTNKSLGLLNARASAVGNNNEICKLNYYRKR